MDDPALVRNVQRIRDLSGCQGSATSSPSA
jgi:hypothetical protein